VRVRSAAAAFLAVAAPAALPAASGGHPGHGPTQVDVESQSYAPSEITVLVGDTVLWVWTGRSDRGAPQTNHTVTSEPGQAESFESDPDKPPQLVSHREGDVFGHRFTQTGTFTYLCRVHPHMRGRVTVRAPEPPNPPPSPAPDGSTVELSSVRLRPGRVCRSRRRCATSARLGFTLSEAARVEVRLTRVDRLVRSWALDRGPGRHALRVRARGLRPGSYRLTAQATTPAGARSAAVSRRLRVR
jgi:plastocyanin